MSDEIRCQRFKNFKVLRDGKFCREDIWVEGEKIVSSRKIVHQEIEGNGLILAPGLIDAQINGALGLDFSSEVDILEKNALVKASLYLPKTGVTAFLPTIVSSSSKTYRNIVPLISGIEKGYPGAEILGWHLEGPFISPEMKGAHCQEKLSNFSFGIDSLYKLYGNLSDVLMVTLDPNLEGALDIIRHLVSLNIIVSAGHTNCPIRELEQYMHSGLRCLTHLFNCMPAIHHREPGIVCLGLISDRLYSSIIADGYHVSKEVLSLAFRANSNRIFIVSDAISALGLGDGLYFLGEKEVMVRENQAHLKGSNQLAGSVTPLDAAIRFLHFNCQVPIEKALEAASLVPAIALKVDHRKGSIREGYDADFVVFDARLQVLATFCKGKMVFGSILENNNSYSK